MINRKPSLREARLHLLRRIRSHHLFHQMLARQEIRVDANVWRQSEKLLLRALDACTHCAQKDACAAWLASSGAAAGYLRFCPNSEAVEALRIAQY